MNRGGGGSERAGRGDPFGTEVLCSVSVGNVDIDTFDMTDKGWRGGVEDRLPWDGRIVGHSEGA